MKSSDVWRVPLWLVLWFAGVLGAIAGLTWAILAY